jgi:predicted DNA-binding protein YlxM (UPF0122 family)
MKKIKFLSIVAAGLACATVTGSAFAASPAAISPATQQSAEYQGGNQKQCINNELLTLLKINANSLRQELKGGKSLADIAAARGVQKQQVIDLLVKQKAQRIDQALKTGKLTQAQADQKKAKLEDRVKQRVEQKGVFGHRHHKHGGH